MPVPPSIDQGDAELLILARAGEESAIAALFGAHKVEATRFARRLAGPVAADDLVADAFARLVALFAHGSGPDSNFRAYLFSAIRNRHLDLQRTARREEPVSHLPWMLDQEALGAHADAAWSGAPDEEWVWAALESLPPTWRRVTELLELEECSITEAAALLELTPAAISSLAYRARQGLRVAYLDQLVSRRRPGTPDCAWVHARLGRYVRASLPPGMSRRLEKHLSGCRDCTRIRADLDRKSRNFQFSQLAKQRPGQSPRHGQPARPPVDTDGVLVATADQDAS